MATKELRAEPGPLLRKSLDQYLLGLRAREWWVSGADDRNRELTRRVRVVRGQAEMPPRRLGAVLAGSVITRILVWDTDDPDRGEWWASARVPSGYRISDVNDVMRWEFIFDA